MHAPSRRLHKLRTASEDILAYQSGSFRDSLLPLLVAGFGLVCLVPALGLSRDQAAVIAFLAVIASGLVLGGSVALLRTLVRSGFIVDRANGEITTWRGLLVRLSSRKRDLAAFDMVLLSPARVRRRHAATIVYLVGLEGPVGEPVSLFCDETYLTACQLAVELAAFLRVPFADESGTEPIIRAVGRPRQALPQSPPAPPLPRPAPLVCRVSWHHEGLIIAEPPVPVMRLIGGPLLLFLLLALPCVGSGAYLHFFEAAPAVNANPLVASGMVVVLMFLVFAGVVLVSMPHVGQRQVVEADESCLRFKTVRLLGTRETSIRSDDVTELRIAFGHLIAVTPRDLRVVCGRLDQPLAREELEWLRQELWQALRQAAKPFAASRSLRNT
jgi:hypothetical protein